MSYFIRVATPADTTTVVPQYWEQQIVSPTQSNIYYNDGYVGLGIPNPLSRLAVDGGATIGADYYTAEAGQGTLLVSDSVGIGTTTPTVSLDVVGAIKATSGFSSTGFQVNNDGAIILDAGVGVPRETNLTFIGGAGDTAGNIFFQANGNNQDFGIQFKNQDTYTNTLFSITSDKGGNLQIMDMYGETGLTQFYQNVIIDGNLTLIGNLINNIQKDNVIGYTEARIPYGNTTGINLTDSANLTYDDTDSVGLSLARPLNFTLSQTFSPVVAGRVYYDGHNLVMDKYENTKVNLCGDYIHISNATVALLNNTAEQQIYLYNPTLEANKTYLFEILFEKVRISGGTAVAHAINASFNGGTATITRIAYHANVSRATANNTPTASTTVWNNSTASTIIGASFTGVNEYTHIAIKGVIRTGASGGTFIPRLRYSANPITSPTLYNDNIQLDAIFSVRPVGLNTDVIFGATWS